MPRTGNYARRGGRNDATVGAAEAATRLSEAAKLALAGLTTKGGTVREQDVLYLHEQGVTFADVKENAEGTYQATDYSNLLAALGLNRRVAAVAVDFAALYTARQAKELAERVNPVTNFGLSSSHIQHLLSVPRDRHEEFVDMAIEKSMPVKEFHNFIKMKLRRTGGHGRKAKLPSSVAKQVQQMVDHVSALRVKDETLWNGETSSVFANIAAAPAEALTGVDEKLEELVQEIALLTARLAKSTADAQAMLVEVQRRLEDVAAASKAAAA